MKLKELLRDVPVTELYANPETDIQSVVYDSRKAVPGCLFLAISGFTSDGNRFIPMAVEKGAAVIVTAHRPVEKIPYVLVPSDRAAMAQISANYFGRPAQNLKIIGVTGTNGKTSVTILLKHVLEKTRRAKVGLIGTVGNMIGEKILPTERTTPESFELQALLAQMAAEGCTYVVMEASSHAIALERIGSIHFAVAAFTNLTEDHLDFHRTMDAYCSAKAELFHRCDRAIVNADDAYSGRIISACDCPVLTTSVTGKGDMTAENVELHAEGIRFTAVMDGTAVPVKLGIPGRFTVYNALTVLGLGVSLGLSPEECAMALEDVRGVKGRVEVVPTPGMPYSILIDYAHTPDGLENVLKSVRDFCTGRVISVFGCGGDRDPMKRPIMGRIGVRNSDIAIITSDNPRTEKPAAIIRDILAGIAEQDGVYTVIEDRRAAIRYAMDIAGKDDIIVLAGKGHETYQDIGGRKIHLDEREEVTAYLEELRRRNG